MGLLDLIGHKYPFTDFHELNLEDFSSGNKLIFANPLQHELTKTYAKNTIVVDSVSGTAYLSLDAVPVGVQLDNADYWLPVFDFEGYVTRANQNFTDNYFSGTDRTPIPLAVGDWLVLDDVLYKVAVAMAADDLFIIGTNIVHFTVEQFLKDFISSVNQTLTNWYNQMTGTINQYKNDIDASELAYRNQLAQDIANTTASLQAQLDAAISGATVDSEVINARIGADNVTYPTLGDAIRTQVANIWTVRNNLVDFMGSYKTEYALDHGFYNASGVFVSSEAWRGTPKISTTKLPHINKLPCWGAWIWKDGNFVGTYEYADWATMPDFDTIAIAYYPSSMFPASDSVFMYSDDDFHNALYNMEQDDLNTFNLNYETEVSLLPGYYNSLGVYTANPQFRSTQKIKTSKIPEDISPVYSYCVWLGDEYRGEYQDPSLVPDFDTIALIHYPANTTPEDKTLLRAKGNIYNKIDSNENSIDSIVASLNDNPDYVDFGWTYGTDLLVGNLVPSRLHTIKFDLDHDITMEVSEDYRLYGFYVYADDSTSNVGYGHKLTFSAGVAPYGYATIMYENTPTISPYKIEECRFRSTANKYLVISDKTGFNTSIPFYTLGDSIPHGAYLSDPTNEAFGYVIADWLNLTYTDYSVNGASVVKPNGATSILYQVTQNISNFKGVILISIGHNDWLFNVPLGNVSAIKSAAFNTLTPPPTTYDPDYTFAEGFRYTIEDLKSRNPDAIIICMTRLNQPALIGPNSISLEVTDYDNAIIELSNAVSVQTVDISQCGIPIYNSSTYFNPSGSPDGAHPNAYGHKMLARYLLDTIKESVLAQSEYLI